jgi:uncharacterized metal-binding protein YceD (DUF177 family)
MAIRIPLGQIKDGLNEFDFIADPAEAGFEENFLKEKLNIYISVEKISNQLDLTVKLSGKMALECDRCLEMYDRNFFNDFELVYITKSPDEKIEDDDYIRQYVPHMKYIDITKDIRDFTSLAIPMRKVPEEKPDGSCSWCGRKKEYWDSFIVHSSDSEEIKNSEE